MKIDLDEAVLATRPFTSASDLGYEPRIRIVRREKEQTLRKQKWSAGLYEVTIDGKRSGIIIRVLDTEREVLTPQDYLTDEFAKKDGFLSTGYRTARGNLEVLICRFYGGPPPEMVLNRFEVVAVRNEDGEWEDINVNAM